MFLSKQAHVGKKLLEFRNLNLDTNFRNLNKDFTGVVKILTDINTISVTNELISSLANLISFGGQIISSKTLLSCYYIKYFSSDVFANSGELMGIEKEVFDNGNKIIELLKSIDNTNHLECCDLIKRLNAYKRLFLSWKSKDMKSMITIYSEQYNQLKNQLQLAGDNREYLENMMKKIKDILKKLVGAENVEKTLEENKPKQLKFDVSLEQLVGVYLKKAFWENFKEQISKTPPDYKEIGNIVNDIKGYMKKIYENRENELNHLDDVLDNEWIELRVQNGTYTNTMFLDLVKYLLNELKNLDAAVHDSKNNELLKKLNNIESSEQLIDSVVESLEFLLERLEKLTGFLTEVRKKNLVK